MKKTTIGALIGAFVSISIFWITPILLFNWDYGILFRLNKAIAMFYHFKVIAIPMMLTLTLIGGLFGYAFSLAFKER